ncbi:hypothetical protein [Micromonospora sp. NPDC007230]|uniref:hypothetical protein n=1 Tax=Micromonospora sp. NPDC007230 TaxID=3364237 RepID=UPI0036A4C6E6
MGRLQHGNRLVQTPGVGQQLSQANACVPGIGARIGPQVGDRLLANTTTTT